MTPQSSEACRIFFGSAGKKGLSNHEVFVLLCFAKPFDFLEKNRNGDGLQNVGGTTKPIIVMNIVHLIIVQVFGRPETSTSHL